MIDIKALAAKAVAEGKDMTQATSGGGDYIPPPEGTCGLRFVAYIETGKHDKTVKGVTKTNPMATLVFEVNGPAYPPAEFDGKKVPIRVSIELNISLNEKAHFFKLFQRLNHEGKAKHIAELLGEAYKGRIVHRKYTPAGGKEQIAVELRDASGFTIEAPHYAEMVDGQPTGQVLRMKIAEPISELKCFLWDYADMAQWASIFIEGEYEARKNDKGEIIRPAKSKNVFQNKIKLAKNFTGSPIHTLLASNGQSIDIPDAESGTDPDATEVHDEAPATASKAPAVVPTGEAATDALAGVV